MDDLDSISGRSEGEEDGGRGEGEGHGRQGKSSGAVSPSSRLPSFQLRDLKVGWVLMRAWNAKFI